MLRRSLIVGVAGTAMVGAATAQTNARAPTPPPEITPENGLERAFLAAFANPDNRPAFREALLDSQVAVVLTSTAPNAPPAEVGTLRAAVMYTSQGRLNSVWGPAAPRVSLTGRAALTHLTGRNIVLNWRLLPMLTLEPEDVAAYLAS